MKEFKADQSTPELNPTLYIGMKCHCPRKHHKAWEFTYNKN